MKYQSSTFLVLSLLVCLINIPLEIHSQGGNPAFAPVTDNPALPRVLLIGDSISIGYTVPARELLKGTANVHRIPVNGGPTSRGFENINQWLEKSKWDVIHFNFGLHDLKFMDDGKHQIILEQYKLNLERLVVRMKKTGAQLIWCSTTPVPKGTLSPKRLPKDVEIYNAAAKEIMQRNNIPINDLYSFANQQLSKIQQHENVHFTKEGSQILAQQVAASIKKALDQ